MQVRSARLQEGYQAAREGVAAVASGEARDLYATASTTRAEELHVHRSGIGLQLPCMSPLKNTTVVAGRPVQVFLTNITMNKVFPTIVIFERLLYGF